MIHTKKMSRIRITGPKPNLWSLINELHAMKLMHLLDYNGKDFETGNSFPEAEPVSDKLVKLRSIISQFNLKLTPRIIKDLSVCSKKFSSIYENYFDLTSKISSLKEKKTFLFSQKESIEPFSSLNLIPANFFGYESISVFKGTIKKPLLEIEIEKTTKDFEFFFSEFQGKKVIALFVSDQFKEKIQGLLAEHGFSEFHFEENSDLKQINSDLTETEKQLTELENKLNELKENEGQFLSDYEFNLEKENEKLEAPLKFAVTENAFVIDGWVALKEAKEMQAKLESLTKNKIFIEFIETKEQAPTALENPSLVKPFEFFMNLYALPKYTELDPTFLVFITFPLFFGFMLGDVGYGIVTLAAFLFLRTKFKGEARLLLNSLIVASLATILFGFVFGEFFGFEFVEHPLLNRVHDLQLMLLISILVGLIHITLGFFIGFYNVLIQHGFKEAVFEKGSWLIIEAGGLLVISEMILGMTSFGNILGGIMLLAGIILLFKGEGVQGIIELPAILSNTLSYARLFAVGLASVQLALIINKFATQFFQQGGLMIIAAILILLLGHLINILLGLIGPFLHSLRLHYVEFFGKFYEGGGKRFLPFGAEKNNV
ncbi:V-type ATP synthase subunit I [Candidatus Micrarchaeota archaeon]|nr:V-type ATP synthase subunit I [Candidatus Micrarchaeota archaeon]